MVRGTGNKEEEAFRNHEGLRMRRGVRDRGFSYEHGRYLITSLSAVGEERRKGTRAQGHRGTLRWGRL